MRTSPMVIILLSPLNWKRPWCRSYTSPPRSLVSTVGPIRHRISYLWRYLRVETQQQMRKFSINSSLVERLAKKTCHHFSLLLHPGVITNKVASIEKPPLRSLSWWASAEEPLLRRLCSGVSTEENLSSTVGWEMTAKKWKFQNSSYHRLQK